jgi:tetratricopeptide (TPR) repeat protein
VRYAILPFDNLTGDASLNWISTAASKIAAAEIAGAARSVASVNDAYLGNATRLVHGYFTKGPHQLHLTAQVEDSVSHKMVEIDQIDGTVLSAVNGLAKRLQPKAESFSTSNEDAMEAWARGDFEKATTLDPSFGAAWLGWMETAARKGDAEGAVGIANRALAHPVKSEVDGLRIELLRATIKKDSNAEHEVLTRLTARVSDPQLLASLGALEVRQRQFALAQNDYKKILAIEPENAGAMNQLGYVYALDGKVSDAEAAFARYRTAPGQEANSYDSLGEAYFINGKFPDAEKAFLRAHEVNAALLAGGDIRKAAFAHWLAGDLAGADKLFDRYLDFRTKLKDPAIDFERAAWQFVTGRKDQAVALLEKSSFPQAQIQIRVWRDETKVPSDVGPLKRAYEGSPPTADGLYRVLYAEALVGNGDREEAKKIIARWPLPDNAGEPILQSLVFPKYVALRRILGL